MTTIESKYFIDTNVLIYSTFPEIDKYYNNANKLLTENNNLFISNQIILEYINVSTNNKMFKNYLDIKTAFSNIEKYLTFINVVENHNINAKELKNSAIKYNISKREIFDLNIYLTMKLNGIENLITFNVDDFKSFEGLNIISAL
ncbi:MAG TPA: PIN domain-containing protein [Spirochaetota bacterium]|jgi:predicted nucleic acid-binding protein|nr:MAG: PIN domain protein [Spirochaetes bacterium ADurb.Bin133]HOF00937.1 PIN domain-containing protein [Spirochaetota bacterium]HOS33292.1 PIN domain-containing protein [Spirochaetota bacterium]HOS55217.1 PIN domain-containing protein [Spirochaetota bacterium]HPK62822.1 PIN domain-containing protein [Spirochaetota bacterium]